MGRTTQRTETKISHCCLFNQGCHERMMLNFAKLYKTISIINLNDQQIRLVHVNGCKLGYDIISSTVQHSLFLKIDFILKGQCHEIFAPGFFHESSSPKPMKITLGSLKILCTNLQRYLQVKVHHRCQRHRQKICPSVNSTSSKFAAGVKNTGGKFANGINKPGGKFSTGIAGVVDTNGK